jgi:hypothetical protein
MTDYEKGALTRGSMWRGGGRHGGMAAATNAQYLVGLLRVQVAFVELLAHVTERKRGERERKRERERGRNQILARFVC